MRFKLSAGLAAALGLPFLIASVLAQTPSPEPQPRAARVRQVPGVESSADSVSIIARDAPVPVSVQGQGSRDHVITSYGPQTLFNRGNYTFAWSNEEVGFDHEANQLAKKLGEAKSDTDRSKIKDDLAQVLQKQFDLRQKRHLDEIKSLEDKIKKLKELVEKRQENRREIVSKRLDQILSDAEGLGW